ncbi:response regulator transcription factor [Sphingobacterium rhinopitheci]|uniref:response regulator transcription factor n=1 Tax=Sphingobacterium rhinopitheci TaxID=2781960 RepID=UPI001F516B0A|nr:response regulator transcription factor [Sphingobacterium rhinopitheci]MCI0920113.1 response regulator transcription factor [Sphingobacterium rhinopitheci]
MKILLIEDEIELIASIKEFLEKENFLIETAMSFDAALEKVLTYDYDCILLDIMLPGGTGLELLQRLKEEGKKQSILILSAKDSVEDKVAGLELGADDYLAKPFHFSELLARIKSIIRRGKQGGEQVITYKNATLNPENREVRINNQIVTLNRKEFDIFYYFILRPTKLLEKTTIAETVWGDNADQADNLDFIYSQVKNLRKKLKEAKADFDIQAVYGVGYKLI